MDISILLKYLPLYYNSAIITLKIASIGILYSIFIGIIFSIVLYYKMPIIEKIVLFYIEFSRNTPLLIQLFFIYYGLPKIGIKLSQEICGIIGITFLGGGYMIETFRSGIESIDKTQFENAYSLGFNNIKTMIYIILPQAISVSIHGLIANIIFLLKETSVFSAISIMDLMFTAKDLIGVYYNTTEALFLLVIFYLLILVPVSIIGIIIERKMKYV